MDVSEIGRSVQAAWSRQRWGEWEATCAPEYRFRPVPGLELDTAQTMEWNHAWFAAFPDYVEEVAAFYAAEGGVAYEVTGTGTCEAPLSVFGHVVIDGRPGATFSVSYVKVLRLDAQARVVTDCQYSDVQNLRDQLGST